MNKIKYIQTIKEIYARGGNLIEYLRNLDRSSSNDLESILISYDFQAGSYIKVANANKDYFDSYTAEIADVIRDLGDFKSIMEVGVGEATVMTPLMKKLALDNARMEMFGFDISWSRIKYARQYSSENQISINLFTANLFNIPLPDNSIEIVYTSHSLEPNGGKEKDALQELYRVASKYVILLEPSFEMASNEGKERMKRNGYIQYIDQHAKDLDFKVIQHRRFKNSINPLNPTALTIIEKLNQDNRAAQLVCPITKGNLLLTKGSFYCGESLMVYPIIDGIPCLIAENGILAAHFNS